LQLKKASKSKSLGERDYKMIHAPLAELSVFAWKCSKMANMSLTFDRYTHFAPLWPVKVKFLAAVRSEI